MRGGKTKWGEDKVGDDEAGGRCRGTTKQPYKRNFQKINETQILTNIIIVLVPNETIPKAK